MDEYPTPFNILADLAASDGGAAPVPDLDAHQFVGKDVAALDSPLAPLQDEHPRCLSVVDQAVPNARIAIADLMSFMI